MRPRRLRVKGYTAFVEEADLDFDGLDLFAITGPTGAGKTSLLQAMTIALYGRAPKLGDDLRQLISPSGDQARFYFEFRRTAARTGSRGSCTEPARPTVAFELEETTACGRRSPAASARRTPAWSKILGLDFDSFTKVVLLPQNEFDAFLRGKPEERRSILTRLLSLEIYGAIQQRANQVATDAHAQAEVLTGLLERDYADATPERLAEVKEARAAAEAAVDTLTARLGSFERAVGVAFETRQRRLAHGQANEDLADLQRTLGVARDEHDGATGCPRRRRPRPRDDRRAPRRPSRTMPTGTCCWPGRRSGRPGWAGHRRHSPGSIAMMRLEGRDSMSLCDGGTPS